MKKKLGLCVLSMLSYSSMQARNLTVVNNSQPDALWEVALSWEAPVSVGGVLISKLIKKIITILPDEYGPRTMLEGVSACLPTMLTTTTKTVTTCFVRGQLEMPIPDGYVSIKITKYAMESTGRIQNQGVELRKTMKEAGNKAVFSGCIRTGSSNIEIKDLTSPINTESLTLVIGDQNIPCRP